MEKKDRTYRQAEQRVSSSHAAPQMLGVAAKQLPKMENVVFKVSLFLFPLIFFTLWLEKYESELRKLYLNLKNKNLS